MGASLLKKLMLFRSNALKFGFYDKLPPKQDIGMKDEFFFSRNIPRG